MYSCFGQPRPFGAQLLRRCGCRQTGRLTAPSHRTGTRHTAYKSTATPAPKKGVVDFYEILGVDDDVTQEDIKTAYRQLAKYCHPDVNDDGHELCILLNEAYTTLSNPMARLKYNAQLEQAIQDVEDDYTGQPLSKWLVGHKMGKAVDPAETRAVFVDECACIGCKMCVWCASGTFRIDEQHGRSRVFAQWVDQEEKIEDAIASCPVDCIHWVEKNQLPALEYVMRNQVKVTDVGTMMGGAGSVADVFAIAARFEKKREQEFKERGRKGKQHSSEQEEARQRAADELVRKQYSWLGPLAGMFAKNMQQGSASTYTSGQDDIRGRNQVGRRRRTAKPEQAHEGTIPIERALVVISKRDE